MEKFIRIWARATLVAIYLIVVAGGVVRMTGSGMGCPDWPKCFGQWVPPTDEAELPDNFEQFYIDKYGYAPETLTFNVFHTWTEYINRLIGFVAGNMCVLLLLLVVVRWLRKREGGAIVLLTVLLNLMMGFQAWLGATVVYSELSPYRITIHMVMALLIVAVALIIIQKLNGKPVATITKVPMFQLALGITLVLSLTQIAIGTQVREAVDGISDAMDHSGRDTWVEQLGLSFYIHRSFSIAVLLANGWLVWLNRKNKLGLGLVNVIALVLVLEIITGIAMAYFDIPAILQPIHLVFASVLFGLQFYLLLRYRSLTSGRRSML